MEGHDFSLAADWPVPSLLADGRADRIIYEAKPFYSCIFFLLFFFLVCISDWTTRRGRQKGELFNIQLSILVPQNSPQREY
jgi:hypothetical protein